MQHHHLQSVGVLHLHPDVHGGAAGVPGEGGQGEDCSLVTVCPQMALTASTYLTLAVAVERYTTVCHPFFKVTVQLIITAAAAN